MRDGVGLLAGTDVRFVLVCLVVWTSNRAYGVFLCVYYVLVSS